jgi:hypothetical protein
VRERTPGLGYEFQHANKLYFEQGLKLNECLKLALADQVPFIYPTSSLSIPYSRYSGSGYTISKRVRIRIFENQKTKIFNTQKILYCIIFPVLNCVR